MGRELTDLGPHLDRDPVRRQYRRDKIEPHAERLELDRDLVLLPPVPFCATGIGNSPPARKLAVWPEIAVRLGCARIVTMPSSASASITLLIFIRLVLTPQQSRSVGICRLLA